MNVNDLFPSKYLAKEDVPQPTVATIVSITQVEMNDNGVKVMKPVLILSAFRKPMVLNKLNAQSVAAVHGGDTAAWVGRTIEVFVDPNVMMQGRMVGGLRLRAPTRPAAAAPTVPPPVAPAPHAAPSGAGAGAVPQLWDYSDGVVLTQKQTTAEVLKFLDDMDGHALDLTKIRVRPAGTKDAPVTADAWRAKHAAPAGAGPLPVASDPIPF